MMLAGQCVVNAGSVCHRKLEVPEASIRYNPLWGPFIQGLICL